MQRTAGMAVMLLSVLAGPPAQAGGGLFGIDHELSLDQNGIWARSYQTSLEYGVVALEVAGSLWFGNDTEIDHTFWRASVIGAALVPGPCPYKYSPEVCRSVSTSAFSEAERSYTASRPGRNF